MANFNTHFSGAAIAAGASASVALSVQLVTLPQALTLWFIGTLSGLAPDLDSDNSTPLKALFTGLGCTAAVLVMVAAHRHLPLLWTWLLMGITYLLVRFAVLELFAQFTIHRGLFHTLIAAFNFGLVAVLLCDWIGVSTYFSWWVGCFTCLGYVFHLLLDELYAVDLADMELKRSFGSAMKPISLSNWPGSIALLAVAIVLLWMVPSWQGFVTTLQAANWSRLFEQQMWIWPNWQQGLTAAIQWLS